MYMYNINVFHLIILLYEGELSRLQELSLRDVQAVFTIQELDDRAVAVPNCQVVLHHQPLKMLYDTSAETWSKRNKGGAR